MDDFIPKYLSDMLSDSLKRDRETPQQYADRLLREDQERRARTSAAK